MLRSIHVHNSAGAAVNGSDLSYVDPRTAKGPSPGSVIGYQVKLQIPERVDFVAGIRFFPRSFVATLPPGTTVAGFSEATCITVTLKTPDSQLILNQVPIIRLWPLHDLTTGNPGTPDQAFTELWFAPGRLIDPRQSYLQWWKGNMNGVVPYQFLYW